jgi:fructokinase
MQTIWVAGEALIDFVPAATGLGPGFVPRCGGSTYNAAKACARMGARVEFISPLSTDLFGQRLTQDLAAFGVGTRHAPRVPDPTTLAFVEFHGADARYAFFNTGSATQRADHSGFAGRILVGDILHVGSISLIDLPGADDIAGLVLAQPPGVLVSIDPNVRPGMIRDTEAWRSRMARLIARADIVKLSADDLGYLHPDLAPHAFAARCLAEGAALVVVTLGDGGATLVTSGASARVPAWPGPVPGLVPGSVIDTVGAGDTVTGAILASLTDRRIRDRDGFARLTDADLAGIGQRAMAAAWLNCQHSGCHPPTRAEVDQAVSQLLP